ncbi:putative ABC transport system permease protein [Thermomonospora echinospora]|uniref:Putative ABC transport system permease protein n=1 Tax=Thermomonospora echinospora TaxID=1992 RepID=A0A1H6C1K0_9ACTN|nr:ABC transporter permease [Thermomonospora echinospora]SEG66577.1 putative ABC transport system permease protein [Thermomonospora echinospora]
MMVKVTLRNLAAHKLRLLLTAVSVILGVAFVAGTLIFTDTMNRQFDDLFNGIGQNVAVDVRAKKVVDGGDETITARPVPATLLERLRRVDGVKDPVGNVTGYAAIVGKDGKLLGGQGPPQLGVNWVPGGDLDLKTGRAPSGPGEIVIDAETAERAGYRVGDQIQVVVNGPPQRPRIVGLADAGHLMGATMAAFDTPTAQRLLLKPGYFSDISMASAGVDERVLRDRVAAVLPAGYEAVTGTQMREDAKSDVAQLMSFFSIFLMVFALISIFVGAFIIFNTFSMLVAQRTRELALLRAIGAARRQITRAVIGEAVAVGFVGATLGLAVGAGLSVLLQSVVGIDGSGGLVFTAMPVIWSYVVGIGVTVVSAYFPARRAAKIPPVAAMRDDVALPQRSMRIRIAVGGALTAGGAVLMALGLGGVELGGNVMIPIGVGALAVFLGVAMLAPVISGPVVRVLGAVYPRVFGTPGRMAQRNALRNPRRTAATAAALMIGLALVTTVNVLGSSMRASVNAEIDKVLGADYLVEAQGQGGVDATAVKAVTAVPGVEQALPLYQGNGKINGKNAWFAAADEAALTAGARLEMKSGSTRLGTDGMMVDTDIAEARNWQVGTVVPVQFAGGATERLRIVGTYAPNQLLGPRVVAAEAFKKNTVNPTPFVLVVNTASTDAATMAALERALAGHPGLEVRDQAAFKESMSQQIDGLVNFLTVLLTMSIIIAAVGVINTLALSVIERTREIGLLRAVGVSRRQLRRMIRLESVVIALFGALLGIGIGVLFGSATQRALVDQGLTVLSVPVVTLAVYLVLAAVIGVLAALWPAWRAGRMDVLKAISVE